MKVFLIKTFVFLSGLVFFTSPVLAGTKVGDIPVQHLDAAFDLAKYTDDIVDITKVTKYGDNAIKHGDDVFIINADGSIRHVDEIEDLAQIDRAVRDIESSGFQFPCLLPAVGHHRLFPVVHANTTCVKQIGDNTFDLGGKSFKGTAEEAAKVSDHLKNGGKFDVDNYHKLINNNGNNPLKNITEYFNWQRIETEFKDLGYTLKKSDDYRDDFISYFEDAQLFVNLQIDHRLPWNFVKNHPDVAKEALDILGIKDLNDPRLMQAISQTNNLNLNKPWNDFLLNNPNPTAQQVVDMIKNAGNGIDFVPSPIRLENSI
jgi:hypothetical protein